MFEFENHLFVWYSDVKKLRVEKGLTQKELADQVGISRQSINAIENDYFRPTEKTILKLNIVLGTFPYYSVCGWRWVSDYLGDVSEDLSCN